MSAPDVASASAPLERDARVVLAHDRGVAPGEIAIGVVIGRASEFFDFFVYALASVLVFPALVFPFVDSARQLAIIRSWSRGMLRALEVRLRVVGAPPGGHPGSHQRLPRRRRCSGCPHRPR